MKSIPELRAPAIHAVGFWSGMMIDALHAAAYLPYVLDGAKRCRDLMRKARRERDEARAELLEARIILSDAVGHNDEPHETLADCARLLVLDCDVEHERAVAAEAAAQRVDLARCEGCPWETRP